MLITYRTLEEPAHGIHCKQGSTNAFIKSRDLGTGTLFVAENAVYWIGDNGHGFTLEYPSISLHAISRDLACFNCECIYLMLDAEFEENATSTNGSSVEIDEDVEEDQMITELRFVPQDKSQLESIFQALSECQALHPDEDDSFSDEHEYGGDDSDGLDPLDNIPFDEYGQVIYQHPTMRGVASENNRTRDETANRCSDEEAMEIGQFDDA